jgi:hypothetical protein
VWQQEAQPRCLVATKVGEVPGEDLAQPHLTCTAVSTHGTGHGEQLVSACVSRLYCWRLSQTKC